MVFRQMRDGRVLVSAKADYSEREFNQEQKGYQDRFGLAVAYRARPKPGLSISSLPARQAGALTTWRSQTP